MKTDNVFTSGSNRRAFLKRGTMAAGAATVGAGLLTHNSTVFASGGLTPNDAALLRFAAAAEILESDFWVQYNELGGVQDAEVPGGSGSPIYTAALANLDSDMAQYIHDNTDDEITHFTFLNAYLASKGASTVDLEPFRSDVSGPQRRRGDSEEQLDYAGALPIPQPKPPAMLDNSPDRNKRYCQGRGQVLDRHGAVQRSIFRVLCDHAGTRRSC